MSFTAPMPPRENPGLRQLRFDGLHSSWPTFRSDILAVYATQDSYRHCFLKGDAFFTYKAERVARIESVWRQEIRSKQAAHQRRNEFFFVPAAGAGANAAAGATSTPGAGETPGAGVISGAGDSGAGDSGAGDSGAGAVGSTGALGAATDGAPPIATSGATLGVDQIASVLGQVQLTDAERSRRAADLDATDLKYEHMHNTLDSVMKEENSYIYRVLCSCLQSKTDPHPAAYIRDTTPAGDGRLMWFNLCEKYDPSDMERVALLKEQLHSARQEKSEQMSAFIARVDRLRSKLTMAGVPPTDGDMLSVLTKGAKHEYQSLITAILAPFNAEQQEQLYINPTHVVRVYPYTRMCQTLLSAAPRYEGDPSTAEHGRPKPPSTKPGNGRDSIPPRSAPAYTAQITCAKCKRHGHHANECRASSKSTGGFKARPKLCFTCVYKGLDGRHDYKTCAHAQASKPTQRVNANAATAPQPKAKAKPKNTDLGEPAFMAHVHLQQPIALNTSTLSCELNGFIVDSACTRHISPHISDFQNLTALDDQAIIVRGVGGEIPASGQGDIKVMVYLANGKKAKVTLKDALYVPQIPARLLSVPYATKGGSHLGDFIFGKQGHIATTKGKIPLVRADNMYLLPTLPVLDNDRMISLCMHAMNEKLRAEHADVVEISPNAIARSLIALSDLSPEEIKFLWHCRLGHPSERLLHRQLVRLGYSTKILGARMPFCDACGLTKARRLPYNTRTTSKSTSKPLQKVHCDVWGPVAVPSHEGFKYLSAFTDDYSRLTMLIPMKRPDALCDSIKRFISTTHRPDGLTIQVMHGDGAYRTEAIMRTLDDHKITLQVSPPYSPGQNGVAERAWQTLATWALAMLTHAKLPKAFWLLAIQYACHLKNRMPLDANGGQPPLLLWNPSTKIHLANLRIFGAPCYVHVVKQRRAKLDTPAYKGIFVGIDSTSGGFLVFKPEGTSKTEGRILDARSVTFDELTPSTNTRIRTQITLFDTLFEKIGVPIPQFGGDVTSDPPTVPPTQDACNSTPPSSWATDPADPGRQESQPDASAGQPEEHRNPIGLPGPPSPRPPSRPTPQLIPRSTGSQVPGGEIYISDSDDESEDDDVPPANHTKRDIRRSTRIATRRPRENSDFILDMDEIPEDAHYTRIVWAHLTTYNSSPSGYTSGQDWHATYKNALRSPHGKEWEAAAQRELSAHAERGTWIWVARSDLPRNANIITSRWVWKLKHDDRSPVFKARIVARGFQQRAGLDYFEVFSPTVRQHSVRLLFALTAGNGWYLEQVDVNTAFLYAPMKEQVFMRPPDGLEVPNGPDGEPMVLQLKRSLYGTKQANRNWSQLLAETLLNSGLSQSEVDQGVFYLREGSDVLFLTAFVDDIFVGSNNQALVKKVICTLKSHFAIKELGDLTQCLGMEVAYNREARTLQVTQTRYIEDLLRRYGLENANPVKIPCDGSFDTEFPEGSSPPADKDRYRSMVGSINYVVQCTRPDLSYYQSKAARKMNCPTERDLGYVTQMLKFLKGTKKFGLRFSGNTRHINRVMGYSDASYATAETYDGIKRRSVTGYTLMLNGATVVATSKLQPIVAQSTAEAEYYALGSAAQEAMFVRNLLGELGFEQPPTTLFEDNEACMLIAKNEVCASRAKHIEVRYHAVRQLIKRGQLRIERVSTHEQLADGLTKGLPAVKFEAFSVALLGHAPLPGISLKSPDGPSERPRAEPESALEPVPDGGGSSAGDGA